MKLIDDIINFFKVSEEDHDIIRNTINEENIKRIFYLSTIGAPVSLLHVIFFTINLNSGTPIEHDWRFSILTIHSIISILLVTISLIIYFSYIKERREIKLAHFCVAVITLLLMVGGAFISAVDQQVTSAINPFIVSSIATSIVLLIRPLHAVLYYLGSYLFFFFLMKSAQPNPDVLISNQVNAFTFTSLGLCMSFILWRLNLTRYKQHRLIENQKDELEENYNRLKFYSDELKESNITKDKLISVIAHDLRSPLASLINVTKLLADDFDIMSQEEIKSIMVSLNKETELTYESLNNLLLWSKTQRNKIEPILKTTNLYDLVDGCLLAVQSFCKQKAIKIHIKIDKDLYALTDSSMIQSVIKNLIINSIKFSYQGSEIEVNADKIDSMIVLSIKDNGVGIKPEILEKLLGTFSDYTTHGTQNEKGTGLGLQICKEFVELNGGRIWAKSEFGKGSTFFFSLQS